MSNMFKAGGYSTSSGSMMIRRSVNGHARDQRGPSRSIADEHVTVAVDDDERWGIGSAKVGGDQVLQRLRLAVAGAADNVHVLEAGFQGEGEGEWSLRIRRERRAAEVGAHHLRRREIAILRTDDLVRRGLRPGRASCARRSSRFCQSCMRVRMNGRAAIASGVSGTRSLQKRGKQAADEGSWIVERHRAAP